MRLIHSLTAILVLSALGGCTSIPGTTTSVDLAGGTITHTGTDSHTVTAVGLENFLAKAEQHLMDIERSGSMEDKQNWSSLIALTIDRKGPHRRTTEAVAPAASLAGSVK